MIDSRSRVLSRVFPGLMVVVAACGGGGGGSSPAPSWRADSLAARPGPLTFAESQHFLIRSHFGGSHEDHQALAQKGFERYVDDMLEYERNSSIETAAEKEFRDYEYPHGDELVRWWLHLMARSPKPFTEVMALFWHDHFATSQTGLERGMVHLLRSQIQMLRRAGTANLRDLLVGIITDPAMQIWLDGVKSGKKAPNENLAREFFELFALGVDRGYTQGDIEQAARALTGYRLRYDSGSRQHFVTWDEKRHDDGEKLVFGQRGRWRAADIVDLALRHRGVAEYVSTKIFEHFCYPDPPAAIVAEMAQLLRRNGWDLGPLLRVLFKSEAFFSARARSPRVKGPVEYLIGFVRTTGLEIPFDEMDEALLGLRQRPTAPPNVGGWPQGTAWLSAQSMLQRGNLINAITSARSYQNKLALTLAAVLPPLRERTAESVVDHMVRFLRVQPDARERAEYLRYLNTYATTKGSELVLRDSPFVGSDPRHLDERVRGLLFLLAQHPSYHVR